jgi:hypothetical protein
MALLFETSPARFRRVLLMSLPCVPSLSASRLSLQEPGLRVGGPTLYAYSQFKTGFERAYRPPLLAAHFLQ